MAAALCPFEGDWMFATYGDAAAVMTRGVDPVHGSSTWEWVSDGDHGQSPGGSQGLSGAGQVRFRAGEAGKHGDP